MAERLRALWLSFRLCRVPEGRGGGLATLIAAGRLCVVPMTVYAVSMGGLLAALEGSFSWPIFTAILVGFVLAHVADNLLNDLSDYRRGVDAPGYFRALYGPHPFIDGIVSPRAALAFTALVIAYGVALALYLAVTVHPGVVLLALLGVAAMLLYSGWPVDAKSLGLGELLVAIVWGPVMAGGTLLALAGSHPATAALVYTPFAATVSLVLIGKHMDKIEDDARAGVATLPVRLGPRASRRLASLVAAAATPLAALGLYAHTGNLLAALAALAALPPSLAAAAALSREKPRGPPRGWKVWPLWYAAWGFVAMDSLGRATIAGLAVALAWAGGDHAMITVALALALANAALEVKRGLGLLRLARG